MFNSRRMLRGSRPDSSTASSIARLARPQPIHPTDDRDDSRRPSALPAGTSSDGPRRPRAGSDALPRSTLRAVYPLVLGVDASTARLVDQIWWMTSIGRNWV